MSVAVAKVKKVHIEGVDDDTESIHSEKRSIHEELQVEQSTVETVQKEEELEQPKLENEEIPEPPVPEEKEEEVSIPAPPEASATEQKETEEEEKLILESAEVPTTEQKGTEEEVIVLVPPEASFTEQKDEEEEVEISIRAVELVDDDHLTIITAATDTQIEPPPGVISAVPETSTEEPLDPNIALLRTLSSDYFLNKHTPSFKCFEQQLCSRSDLQLTLNFFPPLLDPGLDEALNYIQPEEEPDVNGTDKYVKMCKDLTIVPIKRVINSLGTDTLNLKFYGITLKQMRGIADALKVNSNIRYLNFQDNWMSPEATSLISEILRESNSIRVLNLKECRIGVEGAEKLCEGISSSQFLQELDLSYNSLGDKGLKLLQPSLIENTSIKKLNISHNELTENSGETLEKILLENKALEQLDLSWNGFFTAPGNKKLCNGLTKNGLIFWLNLSWNGIETGPAMRPITKYLRKTEALNFLDLSWNRITEQALRLLRGALIKNKSLNEVKLGHNIFTPDEAHFLASMFIRMKNKNLTLLDMEDMCVNKDFLQLKRQCLNKGRTVTHGHVLSNYTIFGPNINKLLFERCRYLAMKPKKKKRKRDFGHFLLSLPDNPITAQDFQVFLKKKKVKKIDKDLLNELLSRFPAKHRKVDCVALKAAYMELYPDTVLPEPKKKKKKKRKGKKHKKRKKKE